MATVECVQMFLNHLRDAKVAGPRAMAALFTDDGKLMPNHHVPLVGKQYIEQYYQSKAEKDPNHEIDIQFNVGDVADGDLVVADGEFRVHKHETMLDHGKFLAVLKKDGESFQIYRFMINTNRGSDHHDDQKCGSDAPLQ